MIERAARLVKVIKCVTLSCSDDAEVIVAPHIALCGIHALEFYRAEHVSS